MRTLNCVQNYVKTNVKICVKVQGIPGTMFLKSLNFEIFQAQLCIKCVGVWQSQENQKRILKIKSN